MVFATGEFAKIRRHLAFFNLCVAEVTDILNYIRFNANLEHNSPNTYGGNKCLTLIYIAKRNIQYMSNEIVQFADCFRYN
jgi:hypothetical protein